MSLQASINLCELISILTPILFMSGHIKFYHRICSQSQSQKIVHGPTKRDTIGQFNKFL